MSILQNRLSFLALALLFIAVSCGKHNPVRARSTPLQGTILFWGYEGPTNISHLFVVNSDGTGFHRLTTDSVATYQPRWSPDGTKIVCIRGDSSFVTILNADGTNPVPLTGAYQARTPCWSPDGMQIAYQTRDSIVVVNVDGSNPHAVLPAVDFSWAKPTTFLLDAGNQIWRWEFGSPTPISIARGLSTPVVRPHSPRLSPTDSTVLFSAYIPLIDLNGLNLFTVKLDGTGLKELIHAVPNGALYPVWSHDGQRVAWTDFDHQRSIWTAKRDGSDARVILTTDSTVVFIGDWK